MGKKPMFHPFETRGPAFLDQRPIRYWTPEWDLDRGESKDVAKVRMPSGQWHKFPSYVSYSEAKEFYVAALKNGEAA